MSKGLLRLTLIASFAAATVAAPALTQSRAGLAALSRLEAGQWSLRDLDDPRVPVQTMCIADPVLLVQVQHRNAPCSRLVIADGAKEATVHYTCPANGFGRTSVRVETARLAKIDTQGIAGNAPFARRFEARRVGPCTSRGASSGR